MTAPKKKPQTRRPAPARTAPAVSQAPASTVSDTAPADSSPTTDVVLAMTAATMDEFVAKLREQGQDVFADQIEANARAAAEVATRLDEDEDVSENADIEPVSENPDILVDANPTLKGEWRAYTHKEVLDLIAGALMGKAESWELEAKAESLKGAANQQAIGCLNWGAKQLKELASVVIQVPEGEIVFPAPAAEPEPPEATA